VSGADRGVKRVAREASARLAAAAWREADQAVAAPKDDVARHLSGLAEALREGGRRLAGSEQGTFGRKAGSAADEMDRAARYLRESDLEALLRDLEVFARRRPGAFVGGALVAGFVMARIVKSADDRRSPAAGA